MNELKKPCLEWCIEHWIIERCSSCYIELDNVATQHCQTCNGTGYQFDIDEFIMSIAHNVSMSWFYTTKLEDDKNYISSVKVYLTYAIIQLLALAEIEDKEIKLDCYEIVEEKSINKMFKNILVCITIRMMEISSIIWIYKIAKHLNINLIEEIKKEAEL